MQFCTTSLLIGVMLSRPILILNYQDPGADSELDQPGYAQVDELFIQNVLNPRDRPQQGMIARENWRLSMDNHPSQDERGMMATHQVNAEMRCRSRR